MAPQKKVVLVTGGPGYIGSHVVLSLLLTQKYTICTIDNYHNSHPTSLLRVTEIAVKELGPNASEQDRKDTEVKVFKGDLADRAPIKKIFSHYDSVKTPVWGVIHIAAHKAVGESMEKPVQYFRNNITGLVNLLEVMSEHSCHRIVYSSSATVYGEPEKMPITEDMALCPQSVYGRTKMMGEMMIKDVCDANPDTWAGISLRYFNPAGAHESGMMGEDPNGKPLNLLPLLAQMAVGRWTDNPLMVNGTDFPTPDGACVRDYLHVVDLADGHVISLEATDPTTAAYQKVFSSPSRNLGFGEGAGKYKAYNLGTGKGMSPIEIIEAMKTATGFPYKYGFAGRRPGDVPWLIADPTLAEKELGFKAPRTLEVMCRDLWNWQSNSPQGYSTEPAPTFQSLAAKAKK